MAFKSSKVTPGRPKSPPWITSTLSSTENYNHGQGIGKLDANNSQVFEEFIYCMEKLIDMK
jgi:hypothetical protein